MELRILLFASFVVSAVSSPVPSKQYRLDYKYHKNTDAFYKLHTERTSERDASKTCIEEGAELAVIISEEDLKPIQNMMKEFLDPEDSARIAKAEGYWAHGVCLVVPQDGAFYDLDEETMCKDLPFVCKVTAENAAAYSGECGVSSNDYGSKISTTGSCYRVSTDDATWEEAHALCQAEGAHLVILNSAQELEVLYNMLQDKPHNSETQYYAGVRAVTTSEPRLFKTVLNQTLEEVGYGPWDESEPNDWHGGENCVALDTRRHGKYNDVPCYNRMPYVCESSGAPLEVPDASSRPSTASDPVSSPVPPKQYRPDYEYNQKTDAFYKLHTEGARSMYASEACRKEGAELVKIGSDEDLKQIHAMMKRLSDLEDYLMVASDDSECNVVNRKGKMETTTCYQELPFVCKVAAKDAPYNEECGVHSNDYESRFSNTGSCYRVSTVRATWNEAYASCQAEGAHLVILSNAEELEVLYNMLQDKPHDSETQYFAGVRADTTSDPRVFKTVLNQTLEQVGYGPWEEDEPNDWHGGENCVVLDTRRHGKYNDVSCRDRMPYVCESSARAPLEIHEPSSTTPASEPVSTPVTSKQYRPNYEYNENTDAFYKLHTDAVDSTYASEKCNEEGAELVNITSEEDVKQIHAMMKTLSILEDYVMVASDENSDYDSQHGYQVNVVNRKGKIEMVSGYQELPFVCKVAAKDAPYSEECDVHSNAYVSRVSTTGSCYRVSTAKATWNEAYASCQAEGAHLVILSDAKELEVLYNMLQDKPHDSETQYFAGVRTDMTSESRVFKTVLNETLEEVGYGPWEENEPNDYEGGENCVVLDTRRHGKYNDVWCHVRMPYVCESSVRAPLEIREPSNIPRSDVTQVYDPVSSPITPKRYRPGYEYNEKTDAFYKLHTKRASRTFASEICTEEGAELVKLSSDEDSKQVLAMMKDLENYVMVESDVNSVHGSRNYYECNVMNRGGRIETISAFLELPFVCKVAAANTPYNVECNVFSNDYESKIATTGSCYRVSTATATWDEAHARCQAEGANLVVLDNADELEVLYNMLQDKPHDSETQYFAGVKADMTTEPRVFKTVFNQTLEEVGYGPWEESEPNDYIRAENCVALDTRRHGKYNDVWCDVKMHYVCESVGAPLEVPVYTDHNSDGEIETTDPYSDRPFVYTVTARDAPTNEECGVLSNDYESMISTTGSCYRVSTDVVNSWSEANARCEAEGAHLVILDNAEEVDVLYKMLQDKPHDSETQYYAGVRAVTFTEPRVFKTVLNQTLEEIGFDAWNENEPNDYEGGENCVALDTRRHGKYNDVPCYNRMPYVCESSGEQLTSQLSAATPKASVIQSGLLYGVNVFLSVYSFFTPYFGP